MCLLYLLHWQVNSLPLSHLESLFPLLKSIYGLLCVIPGHWVAVTSAFPKLKCSPWNNMLDVFPGAPVGFCESESRSVMSNSLQPYGLYSPWNSPGQNSRVSSLSLFQGIFLTQDQTQVFRIAGRFCTK